MRENELKKHIKKSFPNVTAPTNDHQMKSYDLEAPKAILELKSRFIKKDYGDSQIEKQKFDKNLEKAKAKGKDFYYVVYSDYHKSVYYWNVSMLAREGYDFGWCIKMCPKTTDFDKTHKVEKEVGGLKWADAHKVERV